MILLRLFWEFLKIGMFSFGGAYGAIPMIQESVLQNGWMDETMFANIIAVSESTPGPIMVNAATYVGSQQAGLAGAAFATFGVVLPSFVIILLISKFLRPYLQNARVQNALNGIKPALMGVILATGCTMACTVVLGSLRAPAFDLKALLLLLGLAAISLGYKHLRKRELSPILLILLSAVLGALCFA